MLFDTPGSAPSRTQPGDAGKEPVPVTPWTVTQLVRRMKSALTTQLPGTVHLVGEVSDLSRPSSGHVYLTLKDGNCEIRAVMWRSAARSLKFDLTDGLEVLATGSVDVYEPRGQVQFYIRKLQPRGRGALELAFRQLYEKLRGEGLFDPARKRPLVSFPQRIGVVTSGTGAAIRDIIQTVSRRYPPAELVVLPVRVQGEGAAAEIAGAIDRFNRVADRLGGIDLLIVGRGGGSLEDLWAFNEEVVARAIYRSNIVVISAVGHEIDVTISDLVADVRAPTPTAASELAVPDRDEVREYVRSLEGRLAGSARHTLTLARAELSRMEQDELFRRPENMIRRADQQLDEAGAKLRLAPLHLLANWRGRVESNARRLARLQPALLVVAWHRRLARLERVLGDARSRSFRTCDRALDALRETLVLHSPTQRIGRAEETLGQLAHRLERGAGQRRDSLARRLDALAARLEGSSHKTVLRRGFSLTRDKKTGRILRSPDEVRPGALITTQLRDGTIDSRVEGKGTDKG